MNNKKIKTFERCYICDRTGEAETPDSTYANSTTYNHQYVTVKIQPDGKPVCSACMGSAMQAANEIDMNDEWKAEELGWLFGEVREEEVKISRTPEAARKALEAQQNEWRWEDLEKEKGSVGDV